MSYVADLKHEAVDDGSFRAGEKDITFMFRDHAGCCTLSMYATHHWTRLALANAYDEVEALATAHGQRLHSPRLDVAAEIANGPSGGVLVSVKHRLWLATKSPTGVLAVGDDQTASLTAAEARHVQAAARAHSGPVGRPSPRTRSRPPSISSDREKRREIIRRGVRIPTHDCVGVGDARRRRHRSVAVRQR